MPLRALVVGETDGAAAVATILTAGREFQATATNGFANIVDAVRSRTPQVLVLVPDLEASALSAIAQVMAHEPVPILVLSHGDISRVKALTAGAVDVIAPIPTDPTGQSALRERVRALSSVPVIRHIRGREHLEGREHADVGQAARGRERTGGPGALRVVGIGASTGGPHAVAQVLKGLGGLSAAVLVVQHIHPDFMKEFRDWMDRECPLPVQLAVDGAPLLAGRVYLAPANVHLKVGLTHQVVLDPNPETLHRPSADVLFSSIAQHAGKDAIGVLLTGMGDDGAAGLLAIRNAGGHTIAQDEASSAVYGMPRAADRIGAAEHVLPLDQIAAAILGAALAVG